MAVVRVEKDSNYTIMSNYHLDDNRLSLKAIGLLSKMLRLPPDWDYTIAGLARICMEGKGAIRSAIEELEAAGYIIRRQTRSADGSFSDNEYIVYEYPHAVPPTEDSPLSKNPTTGNPMTENPSSENCTQINANITKDLNTNPPISPQGGASAPDKPKRVRSVPKHEPEMFARLWKKYPRGEDKASAIREWDRLKPDRELMMTMSAALERDMNSDEWRRGIGIPYLCRWLSRRRWEDEAHTLPPDDKPPQTLDLKGFDIWT